MPVAKMASNYLAEVTDKKGNKLVVEMRADGYFNASKMCKSTKRLWADYRRNNRTHEFLEELASATQLTVSGGENSLVYTKNGGTAPGTWVHRKVEVSPCAKSHTAPGAVVVVRGITQEIPY